MKNIHKILLSLPTIFFGILLLTFNMSDAADLMKTTKFFIIQRSAQIPDASTTSEPFTILISEQNPEVQSAFIEINGISKGISVPGTGIINVSLDSEPYSPYSIDLISNSAKKFSITHDITSYISGYFFHNPTSKEYVLNIQNNNISINGLSAKLVLTYRYTESSGIYEPMGQIISSTIDTDVPEGAAYNSFMWKGHPLSSGKVRLQLATSNCPNGKTNPPDCNDAGTWSFLGPDLGSGCQSNTYYDGLPDAPMEIKCYSDHNNKRYFRYKAVICSSNDCSASGPTTPEVADVIVNWSR
jgi:hypothetical protein